ncbi:MAG: hypothetical protein KAI66_10755, partial [Lentisphaeria bacterium]|nr:hypothetical protein [Lentisphaeria bacterium]
MNYPGIKAEWNGFDRYDFDFEGRASILCAPRQAAPGRPWIWRARFFNAWPAVDLALLERGWHVAYHDVADLFGCPEAVELWNTFHAHLATELGLAEKPVLEGMSRGGLIIYNWAIANPDKVRCIYADAPVCTIRSWPGGHGVGAGSEESWARCLHAYGMTEEQALAYAHNPVDGLKSIAEAGIPCIHVVGDADATVPICENTTVVEQRLRALGGHI